jgi:secretion/DNA translocation related TadE-like protein
MRAPKRQAGCRHATAPRPAPGSFATSGGASEPRLAPRSRGEGGYATVWALAWLAVCLVLGWIAVAASAVVAEQHHVDGAADLAALAGAAGVQSSGEGCDEAASTAAANSVRLIACRTTGGDVQVTVSARVAVPFPLTLRSVARAGPG